MLENFTALAFISKHIYTEFHFVRKLNTIKAFSENFNDIYQKIKLTNLYSSNHAIHIAFFYMVVYNLYDVDNLHYLFYSINWPLKRIEYGIKFK